MLPQSIVDDMAWALELAFSQIIMLAIWSLGEKHLHMCSTRAIALIAHDLLRAHYVGDVEPPTIIHLPFGAPPDDDKPEPDQPPDPAHRWN